MVIWPLDVMVAIMVAPFSCAPDSELLIVW
jgi:hypothetical protein